MKNIGVKDVEINVQLEAKLFFSQRTGIQLVSYSALQSGIYNLKSESVSPSVVSDFATPWTVALQLTEL